MSDMKRVNPALMLEAARMAIPFDDPDEWNDDLHGHIFRVIFEPPYYVKFNPLTSDSDAFALEGALMDPKNGGWMFGKWSSNPQYPDRLFYAEKRTTDGTIFRESGSRGMLVLSCLSAQTGIELYV